MASMRIIWVWSYSRFAPARVASKTMSGLAGLDVLPFLDEDLADDAALEMLDRHAQTGRRELAARDGGAGDGRGGAPDAEAARGSRRRSRRRREGAGRAGASAMCCRSFGSPHHPKDACVGGRGFSTTVGRGGAWRGVLSRARMTSRASSASIRPSRIRAMRSTTRSRPGPVGHEQQGAARRLERRRRSRQAQLAVAVEEGVGLVEDEQLRRAEQRARQRDALALAGAEEAAALADLAGIALRQAAG